ncbi:DUF2069 domain-containing protein [Gilvimarinus sp. DA14]|uniref:DUF2069 domain-containing protein n=1 Tax=Gilvimarinus sp. DA14 TaxID=2956798 RepID=UPI0020B74241|nr:DUF2069 domain-containing protein [Gilvimarinus sp. DA14]UTF60357.1 DUF2069 domain-containing protein [Gilvimarinus sp. DA14]
MKTPQYTAADIAPLTRRYQMGRTLSLICLVGLCLLFSWVNFTESSGSWVRWAIQTLPLALFIPGCFRGHYRTYSWLCFLTLFYFCGFVVTAMAPKASVIDYLGVGLTVVLFCAAMMTSRWRQHANLAHQQTSQNA